MVTNILQISRNRLKRELNLVTLVAIMIGLNIGGSLFSLTGIGAGLTGPSIFIAQLISSLPILLALIPYLTITSAIPVNCGNYQYAKLSSRRMATAGWMGLFIAIPIGALPLFSLSAAKMLAILFPELPITLTAIAIMTIFLVVNVTGIKVTSYIQLGTVAVLILALLAFIIPGLREVRVENFTPLFTGGAMGLIATSALFFTLLAGGLFGIEMGDEVRNARLTIPRALIISIIIALAIYVFIDIVAIGVMDFHLFANETLGVPAAEFLTNPLLGFFIVGGGFLACTTTINLTLTAAGRYVMASAEDRFFPTFFSQVNSKFGTPHWGLLLAWGLSVITLIINPPLVTLAAMLNFGLLFMITIVLVTVIRLPGTYPDIYTNASFKFSPRVLKITSIAAIVLNVVFMAILAYALPIAALIFVSAAVVGVGLFFIGRKRRGFRKISFISENNEKIEISLQKEKVLIKN